MGILEITGRPNSDLNINHVPLKIQEGIFLGYLRVGTFLIEPNILKTF